MFNWPGFGFVFFISLIKFIGGPLSAVSVGLPIYQAIIANVSGMMTTVIVLSFAGDHFKDKIINFFWPYRKLFTKKNRRLIKFWKKFGLTGVSFMTPILFSPILGTMVVISFGAKPLKVILSMLLSAIFWSITISLIVYYLKNIIA